MHTCVAGSLMVALAAVVMCTGAMAAEFHLATDGDDGAAGTREAPFASLERARDAVRALKAGNGLPAGGVVVEIAGGTYEPASPLELTAEDSGTAEAPIVYRARLGEQVRLVGGRVLSGWQPVTDPGVLARMDEGAQGHVMQTDLTAQGVTDLGEMVSGPSWGASSPGLEVFFNDQPMTLARWPNEGFVRIVEVHGETEANIRGTKGTVEGVFEYEGDRPERWVGEPDVMTHGYWFWDWADQRMRVKSIETERRIITLDEPPRHSYGYRRGMHWYAYNILAELDRPGEWYIDREAGILYLWPPEPLQDGAAMVSVLPNLIRGEGLAHVTFQGLTLEATRGTAVELRDADNVRVEACTIRNVGSYAVNLSGRDSAVMGCDMYNMADGGIILTGGDRITLTPANLVAENNHIHHYGRWNPILKYGVHLNGVGNRASHNLIHHAPHKAIGFGGNDHIMEFNEMHSLVHGANDAGVIYSGRSPTTRGHVIRYNYIHNIYGYQARGANGVYLDDMFCSATIYGNIFYRVHRAILNGGGHDNIVDNNIFVDCPIGVHVDARMMGWAADHRSGMAARLQEVPYTEEPWRSRYPQLLTYLEGDFAEPRGNIVTRNISVGGRFDAVRPQARPGVIMENNLVDEDPRFVDPENLDFRLREDSPAWDVGFEPIPVERIGLYESVNRASWPVEHEIMPREAYGAPEPPPAPRKTGPPPEFTVARTGAEVTVDGNITPAEWGGADPEQAMPLARDVYGNPAQPVSRAWLLHDGEALLVAVDNAVDPETNMRVGRTWGQDEAVELAFRNPALGERAPILVLRGYADGHFESSNEAGAPAAAVERAARGVEYAARVVDRSRWTAEWRIPLASLGVNPEEHRRLAFSLSVRKPANDLWLQWEPTLAHTWRVDQAGFLQLAP